MTGRAGLALVPDLHDAPTRPTGRAARRCIDCGGSSGRWTRCRDCHQAHAAAVEMRAEMFFEGCTACPRCAAAVDFEDRYCKTCEAFV